MSTRSLSTLSADTHNLEQVDPSRNVDKVYHVHVRMIGDGFAPGSAWDVLAQWGRRGKALQSQNKAEPGNFTSAQQAALDLVTAKTKGGYHYIATGGIAVVDSYLRCVSRQTMDHSAWSSVTPAAAVDVARRPAAMLTPVPTGAVAFTATADSLGRTEVSFEHAACAGAFLVRDGVGGLEMVTDRLPPSSAVSGLIYPPSTTTAHRQALVVDVRQWAGAGMDQVPYGARMQTMRRIWSGNADVGVAQNWPEQVACTREQIQIHVSGGGRTRMDANHMAVDVRLLSDLGFTAQRIWLQDRAHACYAQGSQA